MASRPSSFAPIVAFGHRGGAAAPSSSYPPRQLRATAPRAAGEVVPGPITRRALRSEASTISPKCLDALADAADEDGEIDREGYFAVANAMSNGYFSFNGLEGYGDLPFPVKYGFVALSCHCLSLGGDDGCCTGERGRIHVEGINVGAGGMTEDLVDHVADICVLIRDNVGENILPEAPSSSPLPLPSATLTGIPTTGRETGPSVTPTRSPTSGPTANPNTPLPTPTKPTTDSPSNATNPPATNPPTTNLATTYLPPTNPTNPPTAESPTNAPPNTDGPTDEVSLVYNNNLAGPTPSPTDDGVPANIAPAVPDIVGDGKGRGDGDDGPLAGLWAGIAFAAGCIVALMVCILVKIEKRGGPAHDEGSEARPGAKVTPPAAAADDVGVPGVRPDHGGTIVMTPSEGSTARSVIASEHDVQDAGVLPPTDEVFLPGRLEGEGVLSSSPGEIPGSYDSDESGSLDQAVKSGNWEAVAASVFAAVVMQNKDPPSQRTTYGDDTAVGACNMVEV